jgi:hypothetical protein
MPSFRLHGTFTLCCNPHAISLKIWAEQDWDIRKALHKSSFAVVELSLNDIMPLGSNSTL